eukprot:90629_1
MANAMEFRTSKKQANFFMKVIVLGDSGVGKTSILRCFVNPESDINDGYKATIGSDLYMTDISIENNHAQLQMWDTAGQERFNSVSRQLYRGADILVLVYDITDEESFTNVEHWKNDFLSSLSDDHPKPFPILLLGNKSDDDANRQVPLQHATEYAEGHDMVFKECSAITKMNIAPAFQDIALIAMNKVTIPLVYKIDDAFVLPTTFYQDENETRDDSNANGSMCYCQLL